MSPLHIAEKLNIDNERARIVADLKSGDLVQLRMVCERLSVLAENHFPKFFAESVSLIAKVNDLIDQIRVGTIPVAQQDAKKTEMTIHSVELLTEMFKTEPVGRMRSESIEADPKIQAEIRAFEGSLRRAAKESTTLAERDIEQDERALIEFIVRTREPHSQGKLIIAQDLIKAYSNSSFRLRPISLELVRGQILGIVGVNASGKTTLLRILLGELKQSEGVLQYPTFGDGPDPDWIKVKSRIGYVSQTLPRWPGRVLENLQYVASIYGHKRADVDEFLDLLLKRFGLDKFKHSTWDEISGGYKTRFEIVRALLSKPDILILDEPLAYLDIISQQVVLRQLKHLARNRESPIGIIITSQQLYEIESISDRLLVLEGGKTLFSDRVSELSRLIDDLVVEFTVTTQVGELKDLLATHPNFKALFATETGYIAVFTKRPSTPLAQAAQSPPSSSSMDFNDVLEFFGKVCPGALFYARNISNSCRLLFEPQLMASIKERQG